MQAAVIESFERPPRYSSFRDPVAEPGEVLVRVSASALTNLVRGQSSGRHYSSRGELPFVPGSDGVGTLSDGRRVYFLGPKAPFGAMAELSVVQASRTILLPAFLDDVTAAALGNPSMATWGALIGRAGFEKGETVLVNGATGVAGRQAIQVAKFLGARRVIATGREAAQLDSLRELGADETIWLDPSDEALGKVFGKVLQEGQVDIVLDYLWGRSAGLLLQAASGHGSPEGEHRLRYVQIGSISGESIPLAGGLLRSSGVELMGSGLGSLSVERILDALRRMYESAEAAGLKIETEAVPLRDVESNWNKAQGGGRRLVFVM